MNHMHTAPSLGLTTKERAAYSISGLIRALVDSDRKALTGYRELSDAVRKHTGQPETMDGYYLPADVLGTRALSTATGAGGGYLAGSELVGYAAALDRASLARRLGVNVLDGLRTDVTIASANSQATSTWVGENVSAPDSTDPVVGQISLGPRTVVTLIPVSLALMRQAGPAGEQFVQQRLGVADAEAADAAMFQGSGGVQPLGLMNTPGVNTRTGASFDMAAAAAMVKACEAYVNDNTIAWVAGIDAAATLRQRAKVTGGERFIVDDGKILDQPFYVSRSMPAAGLICAPWSSVILGRWGAPELRVETSTGFNTASVRVGVFSMVDVSCERPASIATATAVS
jgi:HK97 family phage major capsid protein